MAGFTKLCSTIITSSVWSEDDKTRIMWITMLATADADGVVDGSIPGMASVARMSLEDADRSINKLCSPDPYSRTKDCDGCRLIPIDGGWQIVNYAKYREKRDPEKRREQTREAVRKYREAHGVSQCKPNVSQCKPPKAQAEAEAEAEAEKEKKKSDTAPLRSRGIPSMAPKPVEVPDDVWVEFQAVRKAKRAPLTPRALAGIVREAQKAGISLTEALTVCIERGWQGFDASWIESRKNNGRTAAEQQRNRDFDSQQSSVGCTINTDPF